MNFKRKNILIIALSILTILLYTCSAWATVFVVPVQSPGGACGQTTIIFPNCPPNAIMGVGFDTTLGNTCNGTGPITYIDIVMFYGVGFGVTTVSQKSGISIAMCAAVI